MKRWWFLLVFSLTWLAFWLSAPLLSDQVETTGSCYPQRYRVRGAYHLHAIGHDGRDRSSHLERAADKACLDFVVVTNHAGESAEIHDGVRFYDGAEWTDPDSGHHHGELSGVHGLSQRDSLRVLNHPTWSGVHGLSDLTSTELRMLKRGELAVEVLNGVRLWRTPASLWPRLSALLTGPGRLDLAQAALSEPGPDIALWDGWMNELGRPLPMVCGSDAHGHFTDYRDSLTIWTLFVPRALSLPQAMQNSELFCVNELLGGAPEALDWRVERCKWHLEVSHDVSWRWIMNGEVIERGVGPVSDAKLERDGIYRVELWREVDLGWSMQEKLWVLSGARSAEGCESDP